MSDVSNAKPSEEADNKFFRACFILFQYICIFVDQQVLDKYPYLW